MIDVEELPFGTVILEPQNIYNDAIINFDEVLHYSLARLVDSFMEKSDLTYNQIIEHLYFNTWGYCPEDWPVLVDDLEVI